MKQGPAKIEKPISIIGGKGFGALFFLIVVFAVLGYLTTANPLPTALSILALPLCIWIVWRKNEPPVFAFICFMQWVAISAAVFYANFFGVPLNEFYGEQYAPDAVLLSLGGLLTLSLGIRIALFRMNKAPAAAFLTQASTLSPQRLFSCYLAAFATCYFIAALSFALGPLRQVAVALLSLKWVFFFVFAISVLQQKRDYHLLIFAILLEFGIGLLGYFSAFKNVFFLLLVILLTGRVLRPSRMIMLGVLGVLLLVLGTIWSAIKPEYRDYISQGEGQHIRVSTAEQLSKLSELILRLDAQSFSAGSETLIQRVGYVHFFSMALRMVPESIPHEDGLLWREAIEHVLKPRFLFPSKGSIDDSERTSYYTGVRVAGAEEGASISLGYMAESYIDFGRIGMFGPIFLVGLFYGSIYRFFVVWSRFKTLGFGMAAAVLVFGAYNYEISNIKLLGGNLMAFLVLAFFERFFGGQLAQIIGITLPTAKRPLSGSKTEPAVKPE